MKDLSVRWSTSFVHCEFEHSLNAARKYMAFLGVVYHLCNFIITIFSLWKKSARSPVYPYPYHPTNLSYAQQQQPQQLQQNAMINSMAMQHHQQQQPPPQHQQSHSPAFPNTTNLSTNQDTTLAHVCTFQLLSTQKSMIPKNVSACFAFHSFSARPCFNQYRNEKHSACAWTQCSTKINE